MWERCSSGWANPEAGDGVTPQACALSFSRPIFPMSLPAHARVDDVPAEPWLEVVSRTVASIRFGSVQVTVHEGRVTQVEAVEKMRFATGDGAVSPPSRFRPRS